MYHNLDDYREWIPEDWTDDSTDMADRGEADDTTDDDPPAVQFSLVTIPIRRTDRARSNDWR